MKKGFTLIELLTVITIIGILSGISFGTLKSGGKNLALSRATHSLATEIRKAQEMSLAMRKVTGETPQGYGIFLQKDPLLIYFFADTSPPYDRYNSGDAILENFCQFEKDICEGKISIDSLSPDPNSLHIVFKPPYPTTIINQNPSNTQASITLSNGSNTKTIKIYKSGLISVE